jgi:transcription initiation factor TFIIE subunit beta
MSKLAKDSAAFKSVLQRQDYTSWHSQPPPLDAQSAESPAPSDTLQPPAKKKRPKASMIGLFLQPQILSFIL